MRTQRKKSRNKGSVDCPERRLLSITGIKEAIEMVQERARLLAREHTLGLLRRGEGGSRLRKLCLSGSEEAMDKVWSNKKVEMLASDTEYELLEELAPDAGFKIAELWNLSESAGRWLAQYIYWGTTEVSFLGRDGTRREPLRHLQRPHILPHVFVYWPTDPPGESRSGTKPLFDIDVVMSRSYLRP